MLKATRSELSRTLNIWTLKPELSRTLNLWTLKPELSRTLNLWTLKPELSRTLNMHADISNILPEKNYIFVQSPGAAFRFFISK